jgi:hypothetical protein
MRIKTATVYKTTYNFQGKTERNEKIRIEI